MRTPNLHTPHFQMPRFGRRAGAWRGGDPTHHEHHRPADQRLRRVENVIDVGVIALIVLLALAMIFGFLATTSYPAYFERVWR